MKYFLVLIAIGLLVMVVVSLGRGLFYFMRSMREDLDHEPGTGATELQLKQNKMMWARIKYQLAAIVVLMVLLSMSH